MAAKDMSRVPWAKDAKLRTPLSPAGGESALIRWRKAILDFFNGILPAVRSLRLLHYYTGEGGWVAVLPSSRSDSVGALVPATPGSFAHTNELRGIRLAARGWTHRFLSFR